MADVRATLPFDETHTVMFAAANNRLGLVPGSGVEHDYAGVVEGSFVLRLGEFV